MTVQCWLLNIWAAATIHRLCGGHSNAACWPAAWPMGFPSIYYNKLAGARY
jgi:hypothetical protein